MGMYNLNEFKTEVVSSGTVYSVNYMLGEFSGSCKYVESPIKSKFQLGPIVLMMESDMGDVIEWVHKKTPLGSKDLERLQYYIREHSKSILLSHLKG